MSSDPVAAAVADNAGWCDLVCRAHDVSTRRADRLWSALRRSPELYPDAVRLECGVEYRRAQALDQGPRFQRCVLTAALMRDVDFLRCGPEPSAGAVLDTVEPRVVSVSNVFGVPTADGWGKVGWVATGWHDARMTIPSAQPEAWSGEWLNPPPQVERAEDGTLRVTAAEGSDAWQRTYYGFTPDSAHALLRPFVVGTALEVSFELAFGELYDQAGILVRSDATHWTKAGAEITDGRPHVGAVVTTDAGSDWSVAPVPEWSGRTVTVRVSLTTGALVVRARVEDEAWRLLRLAPAPPEPLLAGPFLCAPTRAGLQVTFTRLAVGPADLALHGAT